MKRLVSLILSILFISAFQMQSLASYEHFNCFSHHSHSEDEHHDHTHHDSTELSDQNNTSSNKEDCNHRHHCCHSASTAFQAPQLQLNNFAIENLNPIFPTTKYDKIESPIIDGPFQPPRV